MARNYIFYLHGFERARNLSCLEPFYSYLLILIIPYTLVPYYTPYTKMTLESPDLEKHCYF